jgi:hypothetical protein
MTITRVHAVVKEGKVVEQGTHQRLISIEGGAYATLVQLQLSGAELDRKKSTSTSDAEEFVASGKVCICYCKLRLLGIIKILVMSCLASLIYHSSSTVCLPICHVLHILGCPHCRFPTLHDEGCRFIELLNIYCVL